MGGWSRLWARPTQIRPYAGEDRGVVPPPDAYVFPRAFTRQVLPALRPARPAGADEVAQGPPSVAFDGPDHALTVVRAAGRDAGPLFDALGAGGSSSGGQWSDPRPVAHLGFTGLDPIALAPASGDAVVVYTALDPTISAPRWIVAATDSSGAHPLGTTTGDDGRSATATTAGGRVLVAWDDGDAVQVAERGPSRLSLGRERVGSGRKRHPGSRNRPHPSGRVRESAALDPRF